MKEEQLEVVTNIAKGLGVFAVLPTGYCKSLRYFCLPWLFDSSLGEQGSSIVIVASPLTAIV